MWTERLDAAEEVSAATAPLAGPLIAASAAQPSADNERAEPPARVPSLAHRAPLPPHLRTPLKRPMRSISMPAQQEHDAGPWRPTISLNHALNEGLATDDCAHENAQHQPSLYGILVERGLSIGLSPSSPGFHLLPRRVGSRSETASVRSPPPRSSE